MRNSAILAMGSSTALGAVYMMIPMGSLAIFDGSAASVGGLFTGMSIVSLLSAVPGSYAADRYGRKAALLPCAAVQAASLVGMGMSADPTPVSPPTQISW